MTSPFVVGQEALTAGLRNAADFRAGLDARRTERELRRMPMPEVMPLPGLDPSQAPIYAPAPAPAPTPAPAPAPAAALAPKGAPAPAPYVDAGESMPAPKGVSGSKNIPSAADPSWQRVLNAVMMTESGGNPTAVSPRGAIGRFQVMPDTLSEPGFGVAPAKDRSAAEIDRVGREYLYALTQWYGNLDDALVAYNAGPTKADRWIAAGRDRAALPQETQAYVSRVHGMLAPDILATWTTPAGVPATPVDAGEAMPTPAAQVVIANTGRTRPAPEPVVSAGMKAEPTTTAERIAVGKPPVTAPNLAPPMINPELRVLTHYRNIFATKMEAMRRAGDIRYYDEAQKLAQADAAIMNIVGQRALDVFSRQDNPALMTQVMQHYYGPGYVVRPLADGQYQIEFDGRVSAPMSKANIINQSRYVMDTNYARAIDKAMVAARAEEGKAAQELQGKLMIEAVKGQYKLSEAQMKQMGVYKGTDGDYYTDEAGQTYRLALETREGPNGKPIDAVTKIPVNTGAGNPALSAFKVP